MKVKSIRDIKKLSGKTVLLRADLNVPVKAGRVKDDFKITAVLPTIRYLLRYGCKIIIITHLGKGAKGDSVKPVVDKLSRLLGKKIKYIDGVSGEKAAAGIKKMKNGEAVFLKNLRSFPGEEKNDKKFAKSLASSADIYVNDAFAVSHRAHASVSAVKKYLPAFAGLLLEKEVLNLNKILSPKQPLVSIIGGAKINTKIALINNLAKKSYRVLIGGALANNFIAAHGFKIGKSLADKKSIALAARLAGKNKNIILPVDALTAKKNSGQKAEVKPVNKVDKDDIILDIGPKTIRLFASFIKKADTIVWNGPLGYFENKYFKHGTLAVARVIAARSTGRAFGAAGGGETIEALRMTKMENYLDWISTGGGAMLAYLGGEKLPGLKGIIKY